MTEQTVAQGPAEGDAGVDDTGTGERAALAAAFAPVEHLPPGLRNRLSQRADADGLIDVAYRTLDSPFGDLLVAATVVGVVRVAFAAEGHDRVLGELATSISPRILRSPARTEPAARELSEYFSGDRRGFDVALDLRLVHGFRRVVVEHLSRIPYGTTQSYGQVAIGVGNPDAVRAVGGACSHNPLPLLLPCHRVVRSDGSIGQYLGGVQVKAALLALESPG